MFKGKKAKRQKGKTFFPFLNTWQNKLILFIAITFFYFLNFSIFTFYKVSRCKITINFSAKIRKNPKNG